MKQVPFSSGPGVTFSLIKTSDNTTREGFTYAGGSFSKPITVNYTAVFVKHERGSFLFDTGLGLNVDDQYERDMPKWKRPLLAYTEVRPALSQLSESGELLPSRIILSHGHWDHASGVVDFPEADIWINAAEREYLTRAAKAPLLKRGAAMPSQVESELIRWYLYDFRAEPHYIFSRSLDLFEDKSALLVPLHGHTPGSVGLFLRTRRGHTFFFCGDAVWNAKAISNARPKMWLARLSADSSRNETQHSIEQLRTLVRKHPEITVVPSHDATVQDSLGYFPSWVD